MCSAAKANAFTFASMNNMTYEPNTMTFYPTTCTSDNSTTIDNSAIACTENDKIMPYTLDYYVNNATNVNMCPATDAMPY